MLDDEARHLAARLLGVKTDDLVFAVSEVLELGGNNVPIQGPGLHCLEVLVGGQIDQHAAATLAQLTVQAARQAITPELVQIGTATVGKAQAHFQPVGLHQVQRAQQAIQA